MKIEGADELIADLGAAGDKALDIAKGVVEKGALNIKNDARHMISGLAHAPAYPYSISYDVRISMFTADVTAEIGPDKDRRQGALGNLLEYGSVNNAPSPHMGPALDREAPRFVAAVAKALGDVL